MLQVLLGGAVAADAGAVALLDSVGTYVGRYVLCCTYVGGTRF